MPNNKKKSRGKVPTLVMIGVVNLSIFLAAFALYSEPHEVTTLKEILPKDWIIVSASQFISHGTIGHQVLLQSTTPCTIPEGTGKGGTQLSARAMFPNITIKFDSVWSQIDMENANDNYRTCQQEIESQPMIARSCQEMNPTVTTNNHSIFLSRSDCHDESKELYSRLVSFLTLAR